jgi:TM2 domain-containing membrane protein YozV
MKRTITAVLMSALLLPGLGQLYLGRKARGIIIILLVNLLLLLTVFILLKGLAPVIASKMIAGTFNAHDVSSALQGVTGFARALLAGFALLWVYSIVDLLACRDNGGPSANSPPKN